MRVTETVHTESINHTLKSGLQLLLLYVDYHTGYINVASCRLAMPHFIPIKSGFGKKDDCGEWFRTKEPFPIDCRFGFGPEWMWQPCSCRLTTGSPQSVTTPSVCLPREETPMHTGTVGSSHSLFFFQCSHQLPYLMYLGSE